LIFLLFDGTKVPFERKMAVKEQSENNKEKQREIRILKTKA